MVDKSSDAWDLLASAIADGEAVDWQRFSSDRALDRSTLEAMRTLQVLRDWQRRKREPISTPQSPQGYELREELGRGSYARVWLALDRTLGREVALKLIDDDRPLSLHSRERFLAEARVLAALDHPNIVRVHSVGESDGRLFICLERVVGKTLSEVVAQNGPSSPREAAQIGIDLCRALAELHQKGLVHRDLKPSNVMRATGGRIVLLDFGFARSHADRTASGGTPRFMAPEQFDARGEVGPRSDLYALGVMLYWLVTNRYPHEAESFESLREAVLAGAHVPLTDRLPTVPAKFAAIVERALAPANTRFESAGAFERALRDFLASSNDAVAPRENESERAKPSLRFPWKETMWLSLGAALVSGAWLGYQMIESSKPASSDFGSVTNMPSLQMIYLGCAMLGGALLVLQLGLSLLGGVHDLDVGHEIPAHIGVHHGDVDSQTVGISFRTVVAFITFFGLTGMGLSSAEWSPTLVFFTALFAGGLAFWLVGLAMLQLNRLRDSGNVDVKNSVGAEARVYLTIPANKQGTGAVTVPIQGRTMQYRAVTAGGQLATGSTCRVVAVLSADTLEVNAV